MSEPTGLFVGLMSGTSCDGVDAVAVAIREDPARGLTAGSQEQQFPALAVDVHAHIHEAYDDAFRARLLALPSAGVEELARLNIELGARFGRAAAAAARAAGLEPAQVEVVACAGHTVVHIPPTTDDPGATLALGDGDVIAETAHMDVLCDMRARDRAAGGHGAPLVPFADACLLRTSGRVRAALNLGGIANITVVPPDGPPVAFDTGPANMLLDGALARRTSGRIGWDEGGALGAEGTIHEPWLEAALEADTFLRQPPPRSTGRERYGAAFLDRHWETLGALELPDLAATLAAYTIESVTCALRDHVDLEPEELVVSGGGALNRCLMDGLTRRLAPVRVADSEEALGVPVLAREAVSFAVLAFASTRGLPCNVPGVTGARSRVRLGKLCQRPERG